MTLTIVDNWTKEVAETTEKSKSLVPLFEILASATKEHQVTFSCGAQVKFRLQLN